MMSSTKPSNEISFFGNAVYTYTRAQALAEGVFVDVTDMAREAGFRFPVAMTAAAWQDCVAWSDADNEAQTYQDESGRLWDVLTMALHGIRRHYRGTSHELPFELLRIPRDGHATQPVETTLKLMAEPGDEGEPVMTILLPHED